MLNVFPQLADTCIDYNWRVCRHHDESRSAFRAHGAKCVFSAGLLRPRSRTRGDCRTLLAEAIAGSAERFDVLQRSRTAAFRRSCLEKVRARAGDALLRLRTCSRRWRSKSTPQSARSTVSIQSRWTQLETAVNLRIAFEVNRSVCAETSCTEKRSRSVSSSLNRCALVEKKSKPPGPGAAHRHRREPRVAADIEHALHAL